MILNIDKKVRIMYLHKMLVGFFMTCFVWGGLSACEIPDTIKTSNPEVSARPTEADSEDPPCLVTLKCVVDNTKDSQLKKEANESIIKLFELGEPEYTSFCQAEAAQKVSQVPECQR